MVPHEETFQVPFSVSPTAVNVGFGLLSVTFPGVSPLDIGTPEDLVKAVRQFNLPESTA